MNKITYALIDENNKIVQVSLFSEQDENLANDVKNHFNINNGVWCFDDTAVMDGYYLYDTFFPVKPYSSWVASEETKTWIAPTPKPDSGFWKWDEETISWQELPIEINQ